MTRLILSGVLELLGVAAVVYGFSLVAPWLAWIAGGLALVVIGLAVDPPARGGR